MEGFRVTNIKAHEFDKNSFGCDFDGIRSFLSWSCVVLCVFEFPNSSNLTNGRSGVKPDIADCFHILSRENNTNLAKLKSRGFELESYNPHYFDPKVE